MRPGEEALFEEFLMYTEIEVNSDYMLYSMFHALLFSCSNLRLDFRRDVLEFIVNDKLVHGIVLVCIKPLSYLLMVPHLALATKNIAKKSGITRTLMGRYRQLPDAMGNNQKLVGHSLHASINTPIQGGAADVTMMAMIKINESEKLKKLG